MVCEAKSNSTIRGKALNDSNIGAQVANYSMKTMKNEELTWKNAMNVKMIDLKKKAPYIEI